MDGFENLVSAVVGAVMQVANEVTEEVSTYQAALGAMADIANIYEDGKVDDDEVDRLLNDLKLVVGAFILGIGSSFAGEENESDDNDYLNMGVENKELWLPPTLYNYEKDSETYSIQGQNVLADLSQKWFDANSLEEKRKIERQLLYFRYNIPSEGYAVRKIDEVSNDILAGFGGQLILNSVGASRDILYDNINKLNKSEAKYVTGSNYDDNTNDEIDSVDIICSRSSPEESGPPNSVDIQRDANGNVTKYTLYGSNGELVKQVRITGKPHGNIPRPNVKEPEYNTNPKTGEKFKNGYSVRPAEPWELTPPVGPIP